MTRRGGRILLTTIGIWPYPPAVRLHRWSRRELEEVLGEFGETQVEENGGYLRLVPQLANAALAMGVEGYLVGRYGRAGRLAAAACRVSTRRCASGVNGGMRPSGGSMTSDVRRVLTILVPRSNNTSL